MSRATARSTKNSARFVGEALFLMFSGFVEPVHAFEEARPSKCQVEQRQTAAKINAVANGDTNGIIAMRSNAVNIFPIANTCSNETTMRNARRGAPVHT